MMVELWRRNSKIRDDDENNKEDTSGYEKSGEQLARLGSDDLMSVLLHAKSGLIQVLSGMVN
jgi:hypothetical protein